MHRTSSVTQSKDDLFFVVVNIGLWRTAHEMTPNPSLSGRCPGETWEEARPLKLTLRLEASPEYERHKRRSWQRGIDPPRSEEQNPTQLLRAQKWYHVIQGSLFPAPAPSSVSAPSQATPTSESKLAAGAVPGQGPDFTQVQIYKKKKTKSNSNALPSQPPIKKKQGVKRKADTTTADPGGESAEEKKPARQVTGSFCGEIMKIRESVFQQQLKMSWSGIGASSLVLFSANDKL